MTLPVSPNTIGVGSVLTETGQSATRADTDLNWLNGYIKSTQRPATPNLAGFWGMAYYQRNQDGNCTNNGANCDYNCNCNCGNIQCNNCANCATVNCANCDTQSWLQSNCNCACTYNCNSNANCYSYNCNCSKIICTKLFELGMMPRNTFFADQMFGLKMQREEPEVHAGYIRWATLIVQGMEGKAKDFMFWVPKSRRKEAEKAATIKWAHKVATPWSEHMAWLMGYRDTDNNVGRIIMGLGKPLSKLVNKLPARDFGLIGTYSLWIVCPALYYTATVIDKVQSLFKKKNKEILA